jgi:hypothetical protein
MVSKLAASLKKAVQTVREAPVTTTTTTSTGAVTRQLGHSGRSIYEAHRTAPVELNPQASNRADFAQAFRSLRKAIFKSHDDAAAIAQVGRISQNLGKPVEGKATTGIGALRELAKALSVDRWESLKPRPLYNHVHQMASRLYDPDPSINW